MTDGNSKFPSGEPGRLEVDSLADESGSSTRRGPSTPGSTSPNDSGQITDKQAAKAAPTEREAAGERVQAAPVPFPDKSSGHLPGLDQLNNETRRRKPPSRREFTQSNISYRTQLLTRCKKYARDHNLTDSEFFNALLQSAFEQVERGGYPPVYPGRQPEGKERRRPSGLSTHVDNSRTSAAVLSTQVDSLARAKDLDLILDLESEDKKIDPEKERTIDEDGLITPSSSSDQFLLAVYASRQTDPAAYEAATNETRLKETEALEFYSKKTGREITDYDRWVYHHGAKNQQGDFRNRLGQFTGPVADVPLHLIRQGILNSIARCKRGVGMFSYCLGLIHQAVEEAYKEWKDLRDDEINRSRALEEIAIKVKARTNQQMLPKVGGQLEFEPTKGSAEELQNNLTLDYELWDRFLHSLRRLSHGSFKAWIEPLKFEGVDVSRRLMQLLAPTPEIRDWCRTNYSSVFADALDELTLEGYVIEWRVAEQIRTGTE